MTKPADGNETARRTYSSRPSSNSPGAASTGQYQPRSEPGPPALDAGGDLPLSDDLPPWLTAFILHAQRETNTLRDNGAEQPAAARSALVRKLLEAAQAWINTELDASEAAREQGVCEETIRRAVRAGDIPDRRANPRARHKIRRGDLQKLAPPPGHPYDPHADAQDIARLRRKL
jgi:hypothetical protein